VDSKTVVLELAEDAPGDDVVWVLVDVSITVETD
jgi:PP-loop superfamily ATP-utilizing enzyme